MSKKKGSDAAATILFEWHGSRVTIRSIGEYTWDAANGFITGVDVAMAANLLAYPGGEFTPVSGQVIGLETLEQLATLIGISAEEVRQQMGTGEGNGE